MKREGYSSGQHRHFIYFSLFIHLHPSIYLNYLSLLQVHSYIHTSHSPSPLDLASNQSSNRTNTTNAALGTFIRLPLVPLPRFPTTQGLEANPRQLSSRNASPPH
jgi:hypothetical protein